MDVGDRHRCPHCGIVIGLRDDHDECRSCGKRFPDALRRELRAWAGDEDTISTDMERGGPVGTDTDLSDEPEKERRSSSGAPAKLTATCPKCGDAIAPNHRWARCARCGTSIPSHVRSALMGGDREALRRAELNWAIASANSTSLVAWATGGFLIGIVLGLSRNPFDQAPSGSTICNPSLAARFLSRWTCCWRCRSS
jgi:hypothetical protein